MTTPLAHIYIYRMQNNSSKNIEPFPLQYPKHQAPTYTFPHLTLAWFSSRFSSFASCLNGSQSRVEIVEMERHQKRSEGSEVPTFCFIIVHNSMLSDAENRTTEKTAERGRKNTLGRPDIEIHYAYIFYV